MGEYFEDDEKLTYPEADRVVASFLRSTERPQATSRDVLRWSEYDDTPHNRERVYDALGRLCEDSGSNWAGRTVFETNTEP